ncbi:MULTISPECIES: hypothetical protein [Sphingomonas]|uniref:hypothetical protein n=1 Tax=Sphingomonas TaxID=13687 RepID=UPI00082F85C5|nr:hypothetical protein [Sphingomonas sp. CCH10-B3]
MARIKLHKTILPIVIGGGLMSVSRSFERRGDIASAMGDTAGALSGHVAALLVVIAAVVCFGYALYHFIWRGTDAPSPPAAETYERVIDPVEAGPDDQPFDADAIMARYLANRDPGAAQVYDTPPAAPAARPAFGRKRA